MDFQKQIARMQADVDRLNSEAAADATNETTRKTEIAEAPGTDCRDACVFVKDTHSVQLRLMPRLS